MLVDTKSKVKVNNGDVNLSEAELLNKMRLFFSGSKNIIEFNADTKKGKEYFYSDAGQDIIKSAENGPFYSHDEVFAKLYKQFGLEYNNA